MEKKGKTIPLAVLEEKGVTVLYHDISTNGIAYIETGLNLRTLPRKFVQFIPLFSRCFLKWARKRKIM